MRTQSGIPELLGLAIASAFVWLAKVAVASIVACSALLWAIEKGWL